MLEVKSTDQAGRSMVEILGVLAIMGVLTIGGIMGYRYAIDKNRSNEIIYTIANMAISASSQIDLNRSYTLKEFCADGTDTPMVGGGMYPVQMTPYTEGNSFSMSVLNVSKRVCDNVLSAGWRLPYQIQVNDGASGCENQEGGNKMTFYFHCSWY